MSELLDRSAKRRMAFGLLHLIPLLLAATRFTLVTFLFKQGFTWDYATVAHSDAWGYVYHSEYSLPQVLAYLLAYGSGAVLYARATRPRWLASVATSLCVIGFVSFAIEALHWAFDHHLSLIASLPIMLIPIAVWTMIRWQRETQLPDLSTIDQVEK